MRWIILSGRRVARTGSQWLQLARRRLARFGVELELGTAEAIEWLGVQGAEAVTWWHGETGATILFRDESPTLSAVLEEFAHVAQYREGRFRDYDARLMACLMEIEAKECLIDRKMAFGIPDDEHARTTELLQQERAKLESLEPYWSK